MYDLIVIGGGPAGLTATIYAIRKRLNVLMVTRDLGGKTNYHLALPWIEQYQVIRGLETVAKFRNELEYLDFARVMDTVDKVEKLADAFKLSLRTGDPLQAKAVIIASGVRQVRLRVPGEDKYMMRGLCYSALSYAPLFIEKTAVVYGDSDLTLRSAAELAVASSHVHVIGPDARLLATPLGQKLSAARNVTIYQDYQLTEVRGGEFAEAAVVLGPDGKAREIRADGIFIEMGLTPNSKMVADLAALDEQGRIKIDARNQTSVPGIFAAGDVTNTIEQVLVAIGEGAKAALSAYEYLLPRL
jgi:alkyl hydroperoxide reductase subunit F